MIRPEALKKNVPLFWSPGIGVDVWEMFCAAISGDLATIRRLLDKDPGLARSHYEYHTPLHFAVRENQIEVTSYLIAHGAKLTFGNVLDTARDRGHVDMLKLLEAALAGPRDSAPRGAGIAEAIRGRDLVKVRTLLDASPELVHARDERTNQPIHWAVMTRQLDMIDELLSRGADINAQRGDGARPIQLANGDYLYRGWRDVPRDWPVTPRDVLTHLRARGADCDICTASYIGDLERVRELLETDPSLCNRASDYVTYYSCSGTPLRNAASGGHIEVVKLLLERGADPNLPEEHIAPRGHALYSAVYNGHHEIARLLLEHGAYPSPAVESSADALSIALMNSDNKMVELLCSHGSARSVELLAHYGDVQTAAAVFAANPALADNLDAFGSAGGNESFLRLMLRYQPDLPKRRTIGGKTRAITELLFRHGMDPNLPNWLGRTALHYFAESGNVENAAIFLEHGADPNALDEDFCSTPLGWAARCGKTFMVEFLLRRGANPNRPDNLPWATPLQWATRRGHVQIVRLLTEFGKTGALPSRGMEYYEALASDVLARAKTMIDTYLAGGEKAIQQIKDSYPPDYTPAWREVAGFLEKRVGRLPTSEIRSADLSLADIQLLVAQAHGFESWAELETHVTNFS